MYFSFQRFTSLFMLLALMCPQMLSAQEKNASIKGKVFDQLKEPIPGITILVDNSLAGTATNTMGSFELQGLLPGRHTLHISGIGFQKQTHEVSLASGQKIELDIQMIEEALEMDGVVILGKTESALLKEKGFAVNAVETKGVEMHSIQANDLLDQSAGVRIRQDGGLGSRIKYNINGLTGNSIRIFLDGIPMENYGSSFSLSSIPTSFIERIEVYKGVVPAEFGSDALGGAINVITKKNGANTLNTSYSFGSFNTHQWSLNGNYRDKRSGFTFKGSAFYNHSDNNYKVWGDQIYVTNSAGKIKYVEAERFHDDYTSKGTKLDFGFTDVKWADQFFVGLVLSDMDKAIQHGATMESVYGNRRMSQSTRMFNSSYNKHNFLLKGLDVNFFASYSSLARNVVDTVPYIYNWYGELSDFNEDGIWEKWTSGAEGGNPTLDEAQEKKYSGRLNVLYNLNRHNRIAVNFLRSDFSRKPDDPMRPAAERALIDTRYMVKDILGVTYENESFESKLKTSLFFKYYTQDVRLKDVERPLREAPKGLIYNKQTDETGYGLALSYAVSPQFMILTSAENAVRLPENQEVFGNSAENIDPSFELQPEVSINVNLGFNIGPFLFHKHSVKLNSNLFYRDTKNKIARAVANASDETYSFENLDEAISKGVDAEINYAYGRKFSLTSGMSVFNARFNKQYDAYGAEYIYYKDRLRNEPYFTFNHNIKYNLDNLIQKKSRTAIYYNLGYVHEFFRNWESLGNAGKNVIPSQLVNDAGLAYTFPTEKITLSLNARNFLNEQVFDNWALQKPGRAFFVKFNYNLINL